MNDLAVRFDGVGKTYPFFSLEDVDLHVSTGSIHALVGANAAGKSTTIRLLMGLVQQDRGRIQVLGREMPAEQALAKQDVGFVSEDIRLYPRATLAWHMDFIRSIFPAWDEARAADLVERFDLRPQQRIRGLSLGQRVKAVLLLALARRPRLLVLDEPTLGLDPIARHEVLGALMGLLADGEHTILFSSQNTEDVEQISDQITFIDRGRVVSSGDKEELLDRWRRIRVSIPPGIPLPDLPSIHRQGGTDRLPLLTSSRFEPALIDAYSAAGAQVESVERMSLEEIFIAAVTQRRQAEQGNRGGEA